ncbi:hypothetical protein B0A55_00760 [Friedmanniomyces simplex]|uniref:Uncharacterized protein n=1 Tax=Friedmanniomyces simplex TaxID=329884 RepID=A0A4U0Y0S7_9PEZI|nr:hypothetical protein B0A55_00760 [Friedmanniomyces simplex]
MTLSVSDRDRMSMRRFLAPESSVMLPPLGEGSIAARPRLESVAPKASRSAVGVQQCMINGHMLPPLPATGIAQRRERDHPPFAPQASSSSSTGSGASSAALIDLMTSARAPRPSYSEEQRFFIMYTRIVLCLSWQDIESGYAELFGQEAVELRSRGGLTSVYYRIRKRWGLEEVLKTAPETVADKMAVLRRTEWLPPDFLMKMGYLQGYSGPEVGTRYEVS